MKLLIALALAVGLLASAPAQAQELPLATVKAAQLNVRSGPGTEHDILGTLKAGNKLRVSGVDPGGNWLYFRFWGKDAWIAFSPALVALNKPVSDLPIVSIKSTGAALVALADHAIDPPVPAPGEPFSIKLEIRNGGQADAGLFGIAAQFDSGHFAYAAISSLAAGAGAQVTISSPGDKATGFHKLSLALDVDQQLGPMSKASAAEITYKVDRPILAQSAIKIEQYTNVDLHGGAPDIALEPSGLAALGKAAIGLLAMPMSAVHYDAVEVSEKTISASELKPGALIGVLTAEGRRAVLRVLSYDRGLLEVQYLVY